MSKAPTEVSLPRTTRGRRPVFFDDPSIDQMMTFLIELTTEVAVLRERLDTVERLLDAGIPVTREAIEAYQPQAAVDAERNAWRDAYLKRVFRMHPPPTAQASEPAHGSGT
ncbi:MAG: hypothetical protein FGM43_06955 [Sinobacteraceae bacterium]|nr:hypothetical protein [Nevskiaceae bacterium]